MQFKPIPEPPASLDGLAAVRDALPREPDPDADCCARVIERTTVETRDAAADWITFCRALELAAVEADGYRRGAPKTASAEGGTLDPDCLAGAFRDRIRGADAVLRALERANEPVVPETLFAHLDAADEIPASERRRHGDEFPAVWTDRVERILEWAVLFDAVEPVDDGYRPA